VGMGGGAVQEEVALLDVLAVVALRPGQAEQPLLEDRVGLVPEDEREAEQAAIVGDAQQAILAPAVGAGAGMVVGEVVPGGAGGRVVLAHGAPLAHRQVGAPALPGGAAGAGVGEAGVLGAERRFGGA